MSHFDQDVYRSVLCVYVFHRQGVLCFTVNVHVCGVGIAMINYLHQTFRPDHSCGRFSSLLTSLPAFGTLAVCSLTIKFYGISCKFSVKSLRFLLDIQLFIAAQASHAKYPADFFQIPFELARYFGTRTHQTGEGHAPYEKSSSHLKPEKTGSPEL